MISVATLDHDISALAAPDSLLDLCLAPDVADRLPFVRRFLILFGVVCLLVGGVFMSLGAQPVLGFMGIEAVLLYAVYIYCARNARQAERITASDRYIIVRTTDRLGRQSLTRFDTQWTSLKPAQGNDAGGGLIISSKGRARRIGAFLDSGERQKVLELVDDVVRGAARAST